MSFINRPKGFLLHLLSIVGIFIFSLSDWIRVSWGFGDGFRFSLFNVWGKLEDSALEWLFQYANEYEIMKTVMLILVITMILSFVLLIFSLIEYNSKKSIVLAYIGFGLSALVPVIFMISIISLNRDIEGSFLTISPLLSFIIAITGMFFIKKTHQLGDNPVL